MGKLIVDLVAATQTEEWLYDRTNMLLNDRVGRTWLLREAKGYLRHLSSCEIHDSHFDEDGSLVRTPCNCGRDALLAEIRKAIEA